MEMNHRHLHTLTGSLSNLERFSTSDIWNPDSAPADFRKAGLRPRATPADTMVHTLRIRTTASP